MAKNGRCCHLDIEKLNASGLEERIKATLRPLAESVSVKTLQDFLASLYASTIPHSTADVNRLSITAPISAESEYKGYTDGVTEEGAVRYSIASYEEGGQ